MTRRGLRDGSQISARVLDGGRKRAGALDFCYKERRGEERRDELELEESRVPGLEDSGSMEACGVDGSGLRGWMTGGVGVRCIQFV